MKKSIIILVILAFCIVGFIHRNYMNAMSDPRGGVYTDICTADQTGSGSGTSFAKYNRTIGVYGSTINTSYAVMANLTLNLASSGNSVIECELNSYAAAATTGVQLNVSLTGSSSQTIIIDYYTSATAKALCSGTTSSVACASGSSAGTTITPTYINAYSVRSGAGTFQILLKSEIGASAVNMTAGSWCRVVEI